MMERDYNMLITKNVLTKWNSKTKKYYEDLGYKYTKIGDSLLVDVNHLKKGSNETVVVKCDYCGREYNIKWYSYCLLKEKNNNTDCCNNPECTTKKSRESLKDIYGTDNIREIESVNQKIKNTVMIKYGCSNQFKNDDIKEKIKSTMQNKYGVDSPMKSDDIKSKAQKTCMEKYGVTNYGAIYSSTHKGELSPTWKGGVDHHRCERATFEYNDWRRSVFSRDNYTCQCCNKKSTKGNPVELQAHHILNWKDNIDFRYDLNNGITLCQKCHMNFHSLFGKSNNTKEQLDDFLCNSKKIC